MVMTAVLVFSDVGAVFAADGGRFFCEAAAFSEDMDYSKATSSNASFENCTEDQVVISISSSGDSDFRSGGMVFLDVNLKNETETVITDGVLSSRGKGMEPDSAYFETTEEDGFLRELTGIELAPGQIYTARFVYTIDENVGSARNQNVRFLFKGRADGKWISREESFRYTVNYLNLDTVRFADGNRVESGEAVVMGIHTSMYDFDAVMADSDVERELLASASDAQEATPSDAQEATPSSAQEATPSDASKATSSDAPKAVMSDATRSWNARTQRAAASDSEEEDFIVDLGDTSYEIQMINARLNDFEIRRALVNDASENMLVCSFCVSRDVKPGVYFGKIIQESKAKRKTYRSSQGFSLIVTEAEGISLTVQHWGAVETIRADGTDPGYIKLDTDTDENGLRYGYYTVDDVYDRHTQQINRIIAPLAQIYTPDQVTIPNHKQYDSVEELSKVSLATQEKVYADKNYQISQIWVSEDLTNQEKKEWGEETYTAYTVQSDGDGKIINAINGQEVGILLTKDAVIRFFYTEKEAAMEYRPVTFYDHNLSNGGAASGADAGLNSAENFSSGTYKMGVGQGLSGNTSSWAGAFAAGIGRLNRANGYDEVDLNADAGIFSGVRTTVYPVIVRNAVLDTLDSNYNLRFPSKISHPGFFDEKTADGASKKGIKRFDNYELGFSRKGDTYILSAVRRNKNENVLENLENIKYSVHNVPSNTNAYSNEFWPLDEESYSGMDKRRNDSDDGKSHNWHFGMRYEFAFRVGDYDGPMNFYFRGDDDFWMFVDGEKVIDLGGIHSAVGQAVDMRAWLEEHDSLDRDAVHRVTIYYMERGGFGSCCYMQYTMPNCVPVESPMVPAAEVKAKVVKVWDDRSDQDGNRPDQAAMQLQWSRDNGNTWTDYPGDEGVGRVTSAGSWSYEFRHLPKYSGAAELRYRVRELDSDAQTKLNKNDFLPGKRTEPGTDWNYRVTDITDTVETATDDNGNLRAVTTITNSYTPQVTYRKVEKRWNGVPDYMEASVKAGLYITDADGGSPMPATALDDGQSNPVTLTKRAGSTQNTVSYTWKNLPKYRNGTEIPYAVYELAGDSLTTDLIKQNGTYTLNGYDYTVDMGNPFAGNADRDTATVLTNTLLKAKLRLVKEVQNPEGLENEPIDSAYKFLVHVREGDSGGVLYTSAALGNGGNPDDFIEVIPPHSGRTFTVEEVVPMEYELKGMTAARSAGAGLGGLPDGCFSCDSGAEQAAVTVKPGDDITITVVNVPGHKGYFHHTASVTNTHKGVSGGFLKEDDYREMPGSAVPESSFASEYLRAVLPERKSAGAAIFHTMALENPIKTPGVEGGIEENLNGGAKQVWFKNTGEADVFLRAAYTETWTCGNTILPNEAVRKDGSGTLRVAEPQWINTDQWVLDGGWLYYKRVLKSGESTDPVVETVSFAGSEELSSLVQGEQYKDGAYDLHFTIEAVQASDDGEVSNGAVSALFHKELGLPAVWRKDETIIWPDCQVWQP